MTTNLDIDGPLENMARDLRAQLEARGVTDPLMIGIRTGGVWVAERLHRMLDIESPLGALNISFYRDDFTRIGVHPQVLPSKLPFNVNDRCIVLVDDVLFTGRTIRAALNEIFDYGRPGEVLLAVLVERGGRELPIQANVAGVHLDLAPGEHVKLTGPDPLELAVISAEERT